MTTADNKKRRPIRKRVLVVVLLITVISLLLTTGVAIFSMNRIRSESEEALTNRMEDSLMLLAEGRAAQTVSEFETYEFIIEEMAGYIHELYLESDHYTRREVLPPKRENAGILSLQRAIVSNEVDKEAIADEVGLLGNVLQVFHPSIISSNQLITTMYVASNNGFMIAYDKYADLSDVDGTGAESIYDFRDAAWYQKALSSNRKPIFDNVYYDSFGRGLTITCATPYYDADDNLAGVVGMDILIADLYKAAVETDLGEGSYAFIVDSEGNLITDDSENKKTIDDDPDMDEAVRNMIMNGESGVKRTEHGVYYSSAPISGVDWKLCIRMPESIVLEPVIVMEQDIVQSIWVFVLGSLAIVGVVILVVYRFANTLTQPLIDLGEEVKVISSGDLDHRAAIHENDEIGDLATSFNEMAESLKKYIADLTHVTAEKERIGAELNVATQIQADMLPRIFPPFPDKKELQIYASMDPAKEVGGDFYDFFLIDEDHVCLVMADVSGKGVPAALFMVIAKTLLKNRAQLGTPSPAEILEDVNNQLCEGNEAELFVTVWLAIVEISTGNGIAANAGHEHPVLKRKDGPYELVEYKHGPPLAAMSGIPFKEHEFHVEKGDMIFVYTDGVPEATNAEGELYGPERLINAMNKHPEATVQEILDVVKTDIDEFVGEAPQFDDLTMLAFRIKEDGEL